MAGSKGTPMVTTTTEATKGPLPQQMPFYQDLWNKASEALNATNGQTYGGEYLAPVSDTSRQGVDMMKSQVASMGTGVDQMRDLAMKTLNGGFLGGNPQVQGGVQGYNTNWAADNNSFQQIGNTPGLDAVIQAALRPLNQQFTQTVLPGITDQSIAQGAYGGSRQDVSQERAAQNLATASGDVSAGLAYKDYSDQLTRALQAWTTSQTLGANVAQGDANRAAGLATGQLSADTSSWNAERERQGQAGGILQLANTLGLAPGTLMLGLGQQEEAFAQNPINNALAKFQGNQAGQWYGLGDMANILASGNFGTTNATSTGPNPNYETSGAQTLKMLSGGAGMLGSLFSSPAGGTSAAGGLMSMLGLLSDRTEKTDIKKLGKDEESGLDIYAYRYKGDAKNTPKVVGPMAQDVEKKYPGSTVRIGGKMVINIAALADKMAA